MGPGLLLLEGFVQHIAGVPLPESGLEFFLAGGVDALADDHRVLPVQGHRLAVGGDKAGLLLGDLRQGDVPGGLNKGFQMGGGSAAAAAHHRGHRGQGEHLGGVGLGVHVVDRLAPFASGQARVGLEEQRGGGIRPEGLKHRGHLLGAQAAVDAEDVHPQALHQGHSRPGRAAGEELAGAVENQAGKDGQVTVFLHGHHGGLQLIQVAHGLYQDAVCPCLGGGPGRLGKQVHCVFKIQVSVGLQQFARGAKISTDVAVGDPGLLHGRPDVGHRRGHYLGGGEPIGGQLLAVGPEGIGGNDPAARLQILAVDVLNCLRVLDTPNVGEQALRQTGGLEHTPHAAVQIKTSFFDGFQYGFHGTAPLSIL